MRWRVAVLALVVIVPFLVGVQVVATDTGATIGKHWTEPTAVSTATVDDEGGVADLAAAGGDPGAVAWLQRTGETWRVRLARVATEGGPGEIATIEDTTAELDDVSVAVAGDRLAVAWKDVDAGAVRLWLRDGDATRRLSFPGGLLVDEPAVTVVGDTPVAAWQVRRNGSWQVALAAVDGADVHRRWVGEGVMGQGSPALAAAGDRGALAIVHGPTSTAQVRSLAVDGGFQLGSWLDLGDAQPRSTGFASGAGTVHLSAAHDGSAAHVLWTDVRTIRTRTAGPGNATGPLETVGPGQVPRIAAAGGERLVAWIVPSRTASLDVAFDYRGPDGATAGRVSRLPSTATHVAPVFAPAPAMAWAERGGARSRVLFSRYDPAGEQRVLDRLGRAPGEFAAVAAIALVLGLFTLPLLPWTLLSLFGAFVLTSRAVRRRLARAVSLAGTHLGRPLARRDAADRLATLPPSALVAAFAAGHVVLAAAVLAWTDAVRAFGFGAPLTTGVGALLAAVVILRLGRVESNWWSVTLYAFVHNAAMWATALPTFL